MQYCEIFLLLSFLIVPNNSDIIIGGIFDESDETNLYLERSLIYAINIINSERNNGGEKLTPEILTVQQNNPFQVLKRTCALLETGVLAIFGPHSPNNFDTAQSVCDANEVPIIQTRWNHRPLRDTTIVNNYPHPAVLSNAYVDIINKWGWKSFTILYDDNESLWRVNELLKLTLDSSFQIIVRKLDQYKTGIYRTILKELAESDIRNFVIDCRLEYLLEVLTQAQQIGLMNKRYSYFITNLDLHILDLTSLQYSQTNITGIRLINPNNPMIENATNSICNEDQKNCKLDTRSALIIDGVRMLRYALNSIQQTSNFRTRKLDCNSAQSWEYGSTLTNLLKTNQFYGITGLNKFDNEGYRSNFMLEVVELQETGITQVGTWNQSNGLKMSRVQENDTNLLENDDLQNKMLVVEMCLTEPFGFLIESPSPLFGNDRFEGFAVDLMKELADMEKFIYTFTLRDDKDNGAKNQSTQKWSGMIGDLLNHTCDLAIADMTINSQRQEVVDFTAPFMNLGIAILFQKSQEAPPNFFSFADPFAIDTWLSLALAFLVVSLSLYVMGRLCPSEWTNPYPCVDEPEYLVNQFSLQNSFWFSTGSLMQQGTEIAPIAISTRMVAGMWWFLILILVASYTANLAAFLATENAQKLFTDVNSLVENAGSKGIRYGAKAGGATLDFFKYSKKPVYQRIAEYMKTHPKDMVKENSDGVTLAKNSRYAFFMESTSIDYTTQRHCNLEMYGEMLDNKGYGIAMRKHSPYRTRLSTAVLKLQSTGVIDTLRRKWWEEKRGGGQCQHDANQGTAALGMKNVEGVFYVTIGGMFLGILVVFMEKLYNIVITSRKARLSFCNTLKKELEFYYNFESNVKPVIIAEEEEVEGEENGNVSLDRFEHLEFVQKVNEENLNGDS